MKKVVVMLMAGVMASMICSSALAGPKESMQKLAQSYAQFIVEKKEGMPPCPLTDQEVTELSAWIQKAYVKQGQELTPAQVTLMSGMVLGYAVAKDELAPKSGKTGKKNAPEGSSGTTSVPEYDTAAYCQRVSQAGGGSYSIESGCLDMEKEAKNAVAAMTGVPEQVMRYCTRVAQAGGQSYSILQGCIEMEMDSKKQLGK